MGSVFIPYTVYIVAFSDAGMLGFCFTESNHSVHVDEKIIRLGESTSIKSDWMLYSFA